MCLRQRVNHQSIRGDDGDILFAVPSTVRDRVRVSSPGKLGYPELLAGFRIERAKPVVITRSNEYEPSRCHDGARHTGRPVFCLPSGSCSVMPSGICHAKSPVEALIAVKRPHGGF